MAVGTVLVESVAAHAAYALPPLNEKANFIVFDGAVAVSLVIEAVVVDWRVKVADVRIARLIVRIQ